jgi:glycosyltransferase involved in cell wall biosynthesis
MPNLLALETEPPCPSGTGQPPRIFHLLRELSRRYACHLALLHESVPLPGRLLRTLRTARFLPPRQRNRPAWHRLFPSAEPRGSLAETRDEVLLGVRELIKSEAIDTVLTSSPEVAELIGPLPEVGRVVDVGHCLTLDQEREVCAGISLAASGAARWAEALEFRRTRRLEARLTRNADLVTTSCPAHQNRLRTLNAYRDEAIQIVPDGVAAEFLEDPDATPPEERAVIYWGSVDSAASEAAIRHFHEHVFAAFLRSREILWYIVGRNPTEGIRRLAGEEPFVRLVDRIEKPLELFRRIPIAVNPTLVGGTCTGVLEALALRRLVVSTSVGVEGLELESGFDCIVTDDTDDFAHQIIHFLGHGQERRRIAERGRKLVLESYTWEKAADRLDSLIQTFTALGRDGPG